MLGAKQGGLMSETDFGGPPANGTQVALTSSGSGITPFRVTVTENGRLVRQLDFATRADAERAAEQERRAAVNAKRS
jgi:hypothetical protein